MQPRTLFLAIAAGVAVANVYFAQPLLVTMGTDLGIAPGTVGAFVTVTQIGYGLGLFFLVPLGDLIDRRRLIRVQFVLLAVALLVVGVARNAAMLLLGLAAVGMLAVVTQSLVAFAASLSSPAERGRTVGAVTSGIVIGILLARTTSGLLTDLAGWRSVYLISCVLCLAIALTIFQAGPQPKARALVLRPAAVDGWALDGRAGVPGARSTGVLRVRRVQHVVEFGGSAAHRARAVAHGDRCVRVDRGGGCACCWTGRAAQRSRTWSSRSGRSFGAVGNELAADRVDATVPLGVGDRGRRARSRSTGCACEQPEPDLRTAPRGREPADRRVHGVLLARQRTGRDRLDRALLAGRVGRGVRARFGVQPRSGRYFSPSRSSDFSRISTLRIFPVIVIGKSSTSRT